MKTLFLILAITGAVAAQDIATVRLSAASYTVTDTKGAIHDVPFDSENRYYAAAQKWIAAGGVVQPAPTPTVADRRRDAIELRVTLHSRILALERELSQDQTYATQIRALIDNAQAKIEASRAQ